MFRLQFRPTPKLLKLVMVLMASGLVLGLLRLIFVDSNFFNNETMSFAWLIAGAVLVIFMLLDLRSRPSDSGMVASRQLPSSFALNRPQSIRYELVNNTNKDLDVSFSDALPVWFESSVFPLQQKIASQKKGLFEYTVIPKRRGKATFEPAYVLSNSQYNLWQFIHRLADEDEVKVYPDFSAISNSFVFGIEQTMRNLGAHIAKRKGTGMEFNQLREFREGDTLKQIDWKATAKVGTPISREYQEEKDQNIVFLLDCSRRMRAMEKNVSYFDYALNALLLSSYIALDKGDAVGVMTFSGEPSWLKPIKGKTCINTLLNHLYVLDTSTQSSDYVDAAESLLKKHRKRSLIILLTNVRDEDSNDLERAVEILSKQHLVMVVALQERLLESVNELPINTTADTMLYAGTKQFEQNRKKMLALLKAKNVSVVDATHKNIHIKLVTEYLRLKQVGKI